MEKPEGSKSPEETLIRPRADLTSDKRRMSEKIEEAYIDLTGVKAEMVLEQDEGRDNKKDIDVLSRMLPALHEMRRHCIARGQ